MTKKIEQDIPFVGNWGEMDIDSGLPMDKKRRSRIEWNLSPWFAKHFHERILYASRLAWIHSDFRILAQYGAWVIDGKFDLSEMGGGFALHCNSPELS